MNPMSMLQSVIMNNSNPILANAIQLAQNGDKEGVEKIARNICKDRGIDYDKEISKFAQSFGANNKR